MARTKAISLIQNGSTKVELAELSGLVIANIQKETLSSGLKSQSYTGNPASGSVEYKRFKNSASQAYGTARTAGKGTALTVPPTTVNLDTHREIVEEAAKFDLDTFGVGNIMARVPTTMSTPWRPNWTPPSSPVRPRREPPSPPPKPTSKPGGSLIQTLETVKNDYVRGVPRNLIRLVLDPVSTARSEPTWTRTPTTPMLTPPPKTSPCSTASASILPSTFP